MFGLKASAPVSGKAKASVNCQVGIAFDYIGYGFFEHYTKWCPQVVELEATTTGPVREGATGRQVTEDRGIRCESTLQITEFTPPKRSIVAGVSEPFKSVYEMVADGLASTEINFCFELQEIELFMRPFEKLLRTALQEGAQQTVENIKQLLEDPVAA
jgi:hypothetical protein